MEIKDCRNMYKEGDTFYRYDYNRCYDLDEFLSIAGSNVTVDCEEFRVVKVTAHGVWIRPEFSFLFPKRRFVVMHWFGGNPTRKRYAHPNKKDALESFLARKYRQRGLLKSQLDNVIASIKIAERMQNESQAKD